MTSDLRPDRLQLTNILLLERAQAVWPAIPHPLLCRGEREERGEIQSGPLKDQDVTDH